MNIPISMMISFSMKMKCRFPKLFSIHHKWTKVGKEIFFRVPQSTHRKGTVAETIKQCAQIDYEFEFKS